MQSPVDHTQRVVLVTGPSGAGRATAINALEDFGFEAIDNIPLSLVPRLIDAPHPAAHPIALGIDARNRDFSALALTQLYDRFADQRGLTVQLLYLDCATDVLERRYSETRRRHPMAPEGTPREGILAEKAIMQDLRTIADIVIDTTQLTIHDLRDTMAPWFMTKGAQRIALSVQSFSYKRGLPQGLDMAFDCRFLNNPHWDPALRGGTGLDTEVSDYVAADPRFAPFIDHVLGLLRFVIPEAETEGKSHLSVGFGCTGGRHRSVAIAEYVARDLKDDGWAITARHRELERAGHPRQPQQRDERAAQ